MNFSEGDPVFHKVSNLGNVTKSARCLPLPYSTLDFSCVFISVTSHSSPPLPRRPVRPTRLLLLDVTTNSNSYSVIYTTKSSVSPLSPYRYYFGHPENYIVFNTHCMFSVMLEFLSYNKGIHQLVKWWISLYFIICF